MPLLVSQQVLLFEADKVNIPLRIWAKCLLEQAGWDSNAGSARLRLHMLAQCLEVAMSRTVKESFTEKSQGCKWKVFKLKSQSNYFVSTFEEETWILPYKRSLEAKHSPKYLIQKQVQLRARCCKYIVAHYLLYPAKCKTSMLLKYL